jgi:hypothetical protein
MLIHFIHPGRAYLPELNAYANFLKTKGHKALVHTSAEEIPSQASVLWWLCGQVPCEFAKKHANAFHIHEYASASIPPAAWIKDKIKAWRQPLPNYRIFQNSWVKNRFNFPDSIPYEYRDMGVPKYFIEAREKAHIPDFDFVYLGDMNRLSLFRTLLQCIEDAGYTILLVGHIPEEFGKWLKHRSFASITEQVPQTQVPSLLLRARYGLNLIPNHPPFSKQTSTKLLEYCAVGLPIITTDYQWVRSFEKKSNNKFIYLPKNQSAYSYHQLLHSHLEKRERSLPPPSWPNILENMKIWKKLGI